MSRDIALRVGIPKNKTFSSAKVMTGASMALFGRVLILSVGKLPFVTKLTCVLIALMLSNPS